MKICIVGGGPSAFYVASHLLKHKTSHVTILEKSSFPFGLVRTGIAPDHQASKSVISKFNSIASHHNFDYFGNVSVGDDVSLSTLRNSFHAVVLATGAYSDLTLPGINGTPGVYTSRQFINWYNSIQESNPIDNVENVVVIGHGNVALDCARILCNSDSLKKSDMPDYALEQLSKNTIKNINVCGRRGPFHMMFSTKELREVCSVSNLSFDVNVWEQTLLLGQGIEKSRMLQKLFDVFEKNIGKVKVPGLPNLEVKWFSKPVDVVHENGSLKALVFEKDSNYFADKQVGVPNSSKITIPCDLCITCIGYKGTPIDDAPFDEKLGVIPNVGGRVVDQTGEPVIGLYTSGWIKRGAKGVIVSTVFDAMETADCIIADEAKLDKELKPLNLKAFTKYSDWEDINQEELKRGASKGKIRDKIMP